MPLLSNKAGIHTNAILGFAKLLEKIIREEQPTHFLVAFDAGKTTFRHSKYSEYKGGRQNTTRIKRTIPLYSTIVRCLSY